MGYSINKYPYTGSSDFDLNFTLGYISRSDVFVYIEDELDSEDNQIFREFDWLTDNRVRVQGDIADGSTVVLQRVVTKQGLALDFSVSGAVTRTSLEVGFKQLLMTVHELYDGALADRALTVALPQDIENGLAFLANNANAVLAVADQDNTLLQDLLSAYQDITVAMNTTLGYRNSAAADAVQTAADRVATGEDRVAVANDLTNVANKEQQVAADAVQTAADRVATGEDRVAVAGMLQDAQAAENSAATYSAVAATSASTANTALTALGDVISNDLGAFSVNADGELEVSYNGNIQTITILPTGNLEITYGA